MPITISLSSVSYALGYLAGFAAFIWIARRRGLATEGVMVIAGAALVGGLAFANLIQWLVTDPVNRAHGAYPFSPDDAGKTILGGLAGGYLTVVLVKKYLGIARPLGDLFALALSAGEAVGRWGCFFGGCCYGKASHVPWAVWQHGAWRHPTQIYLSLTSLATFLLLVKLELRRRFAENMLFLIQGLLFCASRFVIEFFRAGPQPVLGLTLAQWGCIAGFAFFAVRLAMALRPRMAPAHREADLTTTGLASAEGAAT